jgi:hypothetical protein
MKEMIKDFLEYAYEHLALWVGIAIRIFTDWSVNSLSEKIRYIMVSLLLTVIAIKFSSVITANTIFIDMLIISLQLGGVIIVKWFSDKFLIDFLEKAKEKIFTVLFK